MGRYEGRVVMVTGCGQGLGFDMARAFADEGAKLVMVELNPDTLAEKAERLHAQGTELIAVQGDVCDRATARKALARTIAAFGTVDVLLNAAQYTCLPVPFAEQDDEHIAKMVHSGVFGTMYFMQEAYPALKASRGAVINVASGAGVVGNVGQAAYAAAKEGIRGLSRVAAREWGREGIRVNVISPAANSPSMEAWFRDNPEAREVTLAGIAQGRFADGYHDLGAVVLFLGSPQCFLTGQTLQVDGGTVFS
jgi:NAD(P)-dependent dehydrogenase (short-subunit alcohol dehydrogenase family)